MHFGVWIQYLLWIHCFFYIKFSCLWFGEPHFFIMCIDVLLYRCMQACTLVHRMCALYPRKAEVVGSPGTWITDSWELPCSSGFSRRAAILLTVERLSSPCYISLIQGGVKSEFLNRWFWFYSVQYLWGYFDFGIYQKPAHHIFVMLFLFFLLKSSLCSWTWRSSCLLPPSARIAWVHRHTQPHFSFLLLLVVLC